MLEEPSKIELTPWEHEMPEESGKPEEKGADTESASGDSLEAEPEQAGVPTTGSEMNEEGPVMMNQPDPVVIP